MHIHMLHRHLLTIHTEKHMLFFSPLFQTQHRGLGGISWLEYFTRTVLFWSPTVTRLQPFYFKERTLQFFSLISHFTSFRSCHLPQGFWKLFPSVLPIYMAARGRKHTQMTVENGKELHIKHLMTDFGSFCSFSRGPHLTKNTSFTLYLCQRATDLYTVH